MRWWGLLAAAGAGLVASGCAMWSLPAGLIVGGCEAVAGAYAGLYLKTLTARKATP